MLKIYIARHGQNEDNLNGILNGYRDFPLTELGVRQAQELALHIKQAGLRFDAVYSSPLKRAYDTGKMVTDTLGLPDPIIQSSLIERDFGVMTGRLLSEIEEYCAPDIIKTDTITYFLSPEGAETFDDLIIRGRIILEEVKRNHTSGNVLLVCHGDVGKMIYASYYDLPWRQVLTAFHFGNSELLLLSADTPPQDAHVFKMIQSNH